MSINLQITKNNYHYMVYQNENKNGFIGICLEFPNLTINEDSYINCLDRLVNTIDNMINVAKSQSEEHLLPKPISPSYLNNIITFLQNFNHYKITNF